MLQDPRYWVSASAELRPCKRHGLSSDYIEKHKRRLTAKWKRGYRCW